MKWGRGRAEDEAPTTDEPDPDAVRMTAWVHGFVQGVGFRWWTRSQALELGLVGSATNLADGRVEVVVEGSREACDALLERLRGARTPGGVDQVVARFADARGGLKGFTER
jgi:acylphosphatase